MQLLEGAGAPEGCRSCSSGCTPGVRPRLPPEPGLPWKGERFLWEEALLAPVSTEVDRLDLVLLRVSVALWEMLRVAVSTEVARLDFVVLGVTVTLSL